MGADGLRDLKRMEPKIRMSIIEDDKKKKIKEKRKEERKKRTSSIQEGPRVLDPDLSRSTIRGGERRMHEPRAPEMRSDVGGPKMR